WSSDVRSSDLRRHPHGRVPAGEVHGDPSRLPGRAHTHRGAEGPAARDVSGSNEEKPEPGGGGMLTRKEMLKRMAAVPLGAVTAGLGAEAASASGVAGAAAGSAARDYFRELGLRTFINGRGTLTALTASLMEPEVLEAINYAAQHFVELEELNRRVGERIAEMLRCEAAHVTAGAASAITLATAAALTGTDQEKIRALPNLPGPQREVIVQRGHRIYDQQFLACGVRFVEVADAGEMDRAINDNTSLAFFFNAAPESVIPHEEFIRISKAHGVPTFLDAAADVP